MTQQVTNEENESCAQEILRPWFTVIVIMVLATIGLTFYYADDIRQTQRNRGEIWPGRSTVKVRPKMSTAKPAIQSAVFTPPWHGKQNPDAVTGATPKVMSFNRAIETVSPSVVGINTSGGQKQSASGVIVHRRGYILTNNHVVKGANNIVVTLAYDQLIKSYPAKIVERREDLDLALIKITSDGKNAFVPAPLGDSDKILIGQDVIAIGNPFGLAQSASAGIVSNARRHITTADNRVFNDIIQTDASINPGSSGGALINTKAEVIGISTAIYSPVQGFTGVAFAVPINQAKLAFSDFIQIVQSPLANEIRLATQPFGNEVNIAGVNLKMMAATSDAGRFWLGIDVCQVEGVVAREFNVPFNGGVLVNRVFANSPAAKSGLLRGDVIFRVNDRRVKDENMLWSYLMGRKAGDKVKITLFRNGGLETSIVELEPEPANIRSRISRGPQGSPAVQTVAMVQPGTLPSPREQNASGKKFIEGHWLGLEVIPLTAELATLYQIPKGQSGVLVDEITLEAAESGILAGDLVQSISGFTTPDLKSFFVITQRVREQKRVQVGISRRGSKMTFAMTARNAEILGFAQMEAAQPIPPGALRPHRYMGSCTGCHIFMKTGGQLATDAGDILPNPPPITRSAKAPHRYRGQCATCHTIR